MIQMKYFMELTLLLKNLMNKKYNFSLQKHYPVTLENKKFQKTLDFMPKIGYNIKEHKKNAEE